MSQFSPCPYTPDERAKHQASYESALRAGQTPPENMIFAIGWGVHMYQRPNGIYYLWPEETRA